MGIETKSTKRAFGGTQGTYTHDSEVIGLPMTFNVYVPPGEGPFPAVYFLSGLTCSPENFTTKAGAQRVAAELGLVLVMPDTSPRGAGVPGEDDGWDFGSGAGFYVDATTPGYRDHYKMYSYVTEELPRLVAGSFPVNGRRAITGHSMGGHGALIIGLKAPTAWASVSAFSPICHPSECPWGDKAFTGYFGDRASAGAAWSDHDATELVARHQHPAPILIDQGLEDGFLADGQLRPEDFEAACARAGQAVRVRRHEGYDHSYYFIASFIEEHLRFHAEHLASSAA